MRKRVHANEIQKGDIIYFYNNRRGTVETREVKEIKHDNTVAKIIDIDEDEFWLVHHQKFTIDRKAE